MKKLISIRTGTAPHWVGNGFRVRTLFSHQGQGEQISPFLLLDYAGPAAFAPSDQPRGVGEHPHRGSGAAISVPRGLKSLQAAPAA